MEFLERGPPALKITEHVRSETERLDDIREGLEGRVFHVSLHAYLPSILADGEIKTNKDRSLPSTFGHLSNGFFRNRDCVSLFDYRPRQDDDIYFHRSKCWPFTPAQPGNDGVAILLVRPEVYPMLLPWTRWKEEGEPASEQVVPYVEAGHPGPISTALIDEIICLKLTEDPKSLAAVLRGVRHRR